MRNAARRSRKDIAARTPPRNIFDATLLCLAKALFLFAERQKALSQSSLSLDAHRVPAWATRGIELLRFYWYNFRVVHERKKSCTRKNRRIELNTSCQGGHRVFSFFTNRTSREHLSKIEGLRLASGFKADDATSKSLLIKRWSGSTRCPQRRI